MLFSFQRILVVPLRLREDSGELAAVAEGFAQDLVRRMNRLGEVRGVAPQAMAGRSPEDTGQEVDAYSADELKALLGHHAADLLLVGSMGLEEQGLGVSLRLLDDSGEALWSDEVTLRDGAAESSCSALVRALVEAATGLAPDGATEPAAGSDELEGYKGLLLGQAHSVDASTRRGSLERATAGSSSLDAQLMLAEVLCELGAAQRAFQLLESLAAGPEPSAAVLQRWAVALREVGREDESRSMAREVLNSAPDGPSLFRLGLYAAEGGDHILATEAYEASVHRGFVDPLLFENLGHELVRTGSDELALELWDAALQLDPGLLHLLGDRALALFRRGLVDEAEAAFADALARAPEHFGTHASHGAWLQARGSHEAALEAYSTALGLRADDSLMLNSRGVSRHALGDEDGARSDFERALAEAQDVELLMYIRENLARLDRGALGLNDEAVRMLAEGGQLLRQDQAREAVPMLRSSLDADSKSWTAWLLLALAHRDLGQWEEASRALEEVLTLVPGHAEALSEQSLALLALGRHDEALQKGHEAEAQAPDDAGILCNLGVVCMECGWLEEAREVFEEAATLDPADPITTRCIDELDQRCSDERPWGQGRWSLP